MLLLDGSRASGYHNRAISGKRYWYRIAHLASRRNVLLVVSCSSILNKCEKTSRFFFFVPNCLNMLSGLS